MVAGLLEWNDWVSLSIARVLMLWNLLLEMTKLYSHSNLETEGEYRESCSRGVSNAHICRYRQSFDVEVLESQLQQQ